MKCFRCKKEIKDIKVSLNVLEAKDNYFCLDCGIRYYDTWEDPGEWNNKWIKKPKKKIVYVEPGTKVTYENGKIKEQK